jgi:phosphoglycolate phosphatase
METPAHILPAAVLFDLDGTLVDSLPDLMRALNKLLADLGRRAATPAEVRGWVGDGAAVMISRGLEATGGIPQDLPLAALTERFFDLYRGHTVIDTRPYPGLEQVLCALKAGGHPLGVCTNKRTDLSKELLDGLGLSGFFAAVIGGDLAPARKPDPAHIRATLAALGADGRRAVMVGDSLNDIEAAHAAGIPVVLHSGGYCRGNPHDLGADAVIDRFADLPSALRALL